MNGIFDESVSKKGRLLDVIIGLILLLTGLLVAFNFGFATALLVTIIALGLFIQGLGR